MLEDKPARASLSGLPPTLTSSSASTRFRKAAVHRSISYKVPLLLPSSLYDLLILPARPTDSKLVARCAHLCTPLLLFVRRFCTPSKLLHFFELLERFETLL